MTRGWLDPRHDADLTCPFDFTFLQTLSVTGNSKEKADYSNRKRLLNMTTFHC